MGNNLLRITVAGDEYMALMAGSMDAQCKHGTGASADGLHFDPQSANRNNAN